MVFFGKNEAVIKIKGMCCFFVVLNVAIIVVGVTLIFFQFGQYNGEGRSKGVYNILHLVVVGGVLVVCV